MIRTMHKIFNNFQYISRWYTWKYMAKYFSLWQATYQVCVLVEKPGKTAKVTVMQQADWLNPKDNSSFVRYGKLI